MLAVSNLNKAYGKHQVLKDVSFTLEQGQIVALVGPNGMGKTTLFDVIMNLNKKDHGEVVIGGVPHEDLNAYRQVGYMQDNQVLFPYLTGYDHLSYIAHAQGLSMDHVENIIDEINIRNYVHRRVREYSLGMKQHLLLACAMVHRPAILLLDEPFNGLDPSNLIKIRELICKYANEGTTVFLSSHNLDEIDRMTSEIYFLKDGDLIYKQLYEEDIINYEVRVDREIDSRLVDEYGIQLINPQTGIVNNAHLNPVLNYFVKHDFQIESISVVRTGSEQLYQEIFASN